MSEHSEPGREGTWVSVSDTYCKRKLNIIASMEQACLLSIEVLLSKLG